MEAKEMISKAYHREIKDWADMEPEEERLLCELIEKETGSEFVFITYYPSAKRPFYAMDCPENPEVTLSFDLLFRGLEITTGGQRIHDYEQQICKMKKRDMRIFKERIKQSAIMPMMSVAYAATMTKRPRMPRISVRSV